MKNSGNRGLKPKNVNNAADDPEFDDTDDELNIKPTVKSSISDFDAEKSKQCLY